MKCYICKQKFEAKKATKIVTGFDENGRWCSMVVCTKCDLVENALKTK